MVGDGCCGIGWGGRGLYPGEEGCVWYEMVAGGGRVAGELEGGF